MTDATATRWFWFVVAVLAVWRVTHLLHLEHGPWGLFSALRTALARIGLGGLFGCFFCLSLWTAAPAAWWLGDDWVGRAALWLALSAGAILIEVRGLGGPSPPGNGRE